MSHKHHNKPVTHNNRDNHGNFPEPKRAGDKINYHVLKCRPVITRSSPQVQKQHLQVLLEIDSGERFWMTINIRNGEDKVQYCLDNDYKHPVTQKILDAQLPQGFSELKSEPDGVALDYIREKLFDFEQLDKLENENDASSLENMLTTLLVNAFRFEDARLFVFGSMFTDGTKFSSYHLAVGIHDIHMNQGSVGAHESSNGIYQDGALLIFYPTEKRWAAVFMKFKTQVIQTDNFGNSV